MKFRATKVDRHQPTHDFLSGLARLVSIVGLAVASLSLGFAAHAQSTPQTIKGIFTNATSAPDWIIHSARQVTLQSSSTDGSGWLRLMHPGDRDWLGILQAKASLPSNVPIRVEFDTVTWGGGSQMNEGLAVYFFDAQAPSGGGGGWARSGMGYCRMWGAYVGIAIDDRGAFGLSRCGITGSLAMPTSGYPGAARPNSVTVRGPATDVRDTSTPFVTSVPLDGIVERICYSCTDRNQAIAKALRHVELNMTPRAAPAVGYVLDMKINGRDVLKNVEYPHAAPAQLGMGLVSSSGGGAAYQEVRNVTVTTSGPVAPPSNCTNGVLLDGQCLPISGASKDWNALVSLSDVVRQPPPPELMDGNLAQKGWDGNAPWTKIHPKMTGELDCVQYELTSKATQGVPANQIVIVSRQDDAANAVEPTQSTEFTKHGAVDFEVRASTDDGVSSLDNPLFIRDNKKVLVRYELPKTEIINYVTVWICKTADGGTSPLAEILVWEKK